MGRLGAGSLRFRLTAWYAGLLALVLLTLSVSILALARSQLQADMDERLRGTAKDLASTIIYNSTVATWANGPIDFDNMQEQLGSFASRGLWIQIVGNDNRVVVSSKYAPDTVPLIDQSNRLGDPTPILGTARMGGDEVRAVRYPLLVSDRGGAKWTIGSILVGEHVDTLNQTLDSLRQVLIWTSLGGLALAVVGGWLLAGRALRPVDRVTATAARIAAEAGTPAALATRLPVSAAHDEIARLSSTFNVMLDRLEASFQAQARFVADASHELRTPLTAIRGNIDVLARQVAAGDRLAPGADVAAAIGDIQRESARMGRLLDDLLLLARADAAAAAGPSALRQPLEPVRLDELAGEAVRTATGLARGQVVALDAPSPVVVLGDRDRLLQLALILLDNALRHTPAGGRVTVAVAAGGAPGHAQLSVRDEGDGIAAAHVPHLFDRFYRVDGARDRGRGGTGLGLAIARAIARAHGGEIGVASRPGEGSAFTLSLPLAVAEQSGRRPSARLRSRQLGPGRLQDVEVDQQGQQPADQHDEGDRQQEADHRLPSKPERIDARHLAQSVQHRGDPS